MWKVRAYLKKYALIFPLKQQKKHFSKEVSYGKDRGNSDEA